METANHTGHCSVNTRRECPVSLKLDHIQSIGSSTGVVKKSQMSSNWFTISSPLHFCPSILVTFSSISLYLIFYSLTVLPFTVDISRDYSGTLYAGTPLTLTCNITLDDLVDIPVIVTNQWTRNMMNITEPTITESLIQTDTNHYTATLDFYPLSAVYDNGEYKCTVLVTADTYVTNIISDASTDIVIEGQYIYKYNETHKIH